MLSIFFIGIGYLTYVLYTYVSKIIVTIVTAQAINLLIIVLVLFRLNTKIPTIQSAPIKNALHRYAVIMACDIY